MQVLDDFEQLLAQLGQPDLPKSTLYRFSNLQGQELDRLAEAWPSLPTEQRQTVISRLVEIAEADFEVDFTEIFKLCLRDDSDQVRTTAIEGLWEVEDAALIRPFVHLLCDDGAIVVREAAATSLNRFALQAELGRLQTRLADMVWNVLWETIHNAREDLSVRCRAVESLAYFGRPEVKQVIERAYQDQENEMRVSAVFAMGRSADEVWADAILTELDTEDPKMRYEATCACGAARIIEAIPALSKMVADPDLEVKLAAVWSLGQIGGPEAKRVLEICYEMEDEAIQDAADEALAELDLGQGTHDFPMYEFDHSDVDEDLGFWEDEEEIG